MDGETEAQERKVAALAPAAGSRAGGGQDRAAGAEVGQRDLTARPRGPEEPGPGGGRPAAAGGEGRAEPGVTGLCRGSALLKPPSGPWSSQHR